MYRYLLVECHSVCNEKGKLNIIGFDRYSDAIEFIAYNQHISCVVHETDEFKKQLEVKMSSFKILYYINDDKTIWWSVLDMVLGYVPQLNIQLNDIPASEKICLNSLICKHKL